ncbi:hypothetical protein MMPV_002023 [Pyropia vietnamensis]
MVDNKLSNGSGSADLEPSLKAHRTVVRGTVDGPEDLVYAKLRDFGGWGAWWPAMVSCAVTPAGPPAVGQERAFTVSNSRAYREVLTWLDDDAHILEYRLVSAEPPLLEIGSRTTVEVKAVGPRTTHLTWENSFQPAHNVDPEVIRDGQTTAYESIIQSLQHELVDGSPLPPLRLTVTKIELRRNVTGGHLLVSLAGVEHSRLCLTGAGTPVEQGPITLQLASTNQELCLELVAANGESLATGTVAVQALLDGPVTHPVVLVDKCGTEVGTYTLSVVNSPPRSPVEAATALLFSLGKSLGEQLLQTVHFIGHDDGRWAYGVYKAADGSALTMPKYCQVLPPSQALRPERLGQLFARNAEFLYAQADLLKLLVDTNPPGLEDMPPAVRDRLAKEAALQKQIKARLTHDPAPFRMTFSGAHPAPERVIETWRDDEEQASQMVRGINPMKLCRVTDAASELPPVFHGLRDSAGRGVMELAAAGALFYADYAELMVGDLDEETGAYSHLAESAVIDSTIGGVKYWYAPRVVVYKTLAGRLSFLGFTLTRRGEAAGDDELYTAATTPPVRYTLAKIHLTCADNQVHQFVSHLGMTHLLAEPFIIAAHNVLPSSHIVSALLAPHFTDTIGINFLARQTLVSSVAPLTDSTFSVGTGHALSIFAAAYKSWDFLGDNFVGGLAKRGFTADAAADGLDNFYYRDDGFRVWNALARYVSNVLTSHYGVGAAGDEAVTRDQVLADWCVEMRDPTAAGVASFPAAFQTVAALTEALVTIIFNCSAQHAAVNFPQAEYVAYVPNRPDSVRCAMPPPPAEGDDNDAALIRATLPDVAVSVFQTLFAHLLTTPSETPASTYAALKEENPTAWGAFVADLDQLQRDIDRRNAALVAAGRAPYPYLAPENMPLSIDI